MVLNNNFPNNLARGSVRRHTFFVDASRPQQFLIQSLQKWPHPIRVCQAVFDCVCYHLPGFAFVHSILKKLCQTATKLSLKSWSSLTIFPATIECIFSNSISPPIRIAHFADKLRQNRNVDYHLGGGPWGGNQDRAVDFCNNHSSEYEIH